MIINYYIIKLNERWWHKSLKCKIIITPFWFNWLNIFISMVQWILYVSITVTWSSVS